MATRKPRPLEATVSSQAPTDFSPTCPARPSNATASNTPSSSNVLLGKKSSVRTTNSKITPPTTPTPTSAKPTATRALFSATKPIHKIHLSCHGPCKDIASPSRAWVLVDLDTGIKSGENYCIDQIAHGNTRNYLFADGHVAASKTKL
ncbi:hypothetical protein Ga0100230_010830 [Opitutaceae bacterium TAV3]|nr:hypothetical protein Ga0100230_010830 [Opitutaceae bacterium TAV3]